MIVSQVKYHSYRRHRLAILFVPFLDSVLAEVVYIESLVYVLVTVKHLAWREHDLAVAVVGVRWRDPLVVDIGYF
jgi:hypothetical protein